MKMELGRNNSNAQETSEVAALRSARPVSIRLGRLLAKAKKVSSGLAVIAGRQPKNQILGFDPSLSLSLTEFVPSRKSIDRFDLGRSSMGIAPFSFAVPQIPIGTEAASGSRVKAGDQVSSISGCRRTQK